MVGESIESRAGVGWNSDLRGGRNSLQTGGGVGKRFVIPSSPDTTQSRPSAYLCEYQRR